MEKDADALKVVGIDSAGYGKIPKLVMQDRRLTPEAKCIYGYFASYAGSGNSAFPSVSKILYDLCMGRARYYKHFALLISYGYIEIEQAKESGKFARNVYILNCQIVDKNPPCTQNRTTDKNSPCTQNRTTENETTGNRTTNNNNLKNNSNNKRKYKKKDSPRGKTAPTSEKYKDFYL